MRTRAPAKVNLTLHVLGRRADGYHELESLVAFAGVADHLSLEPGPALTLAVEGPTAGSSGPPDRNLVVRAVLALAERANGIRTGAFRLVKHLPAAAGIGGGSSDAAAALRLVSAANGLALDHPAVVEAARVTGADIPVCLEGRARMMRGAGEELGPSIALPPLPCLLVNSGVAVPTADVFRRLGLSAGEASPGAEHPGLDRLAAAGPPTIDALLAILHAGRNDLEAPAIAAAPVIGEALALLRDDPECRLARMSGSGATVFGLYAGRQEVVQAASRLRASQPDWWIRPTLLR